MNTSAALVINRNSLETLDLRSLTAIQRNHIVALNNQLLCNFGFTIDWEQIFEDNTRQMFIPDRKEQTISHAGCDIAIRKYTDDRTKHSCHGSCPVVNGRGYCWGPTPEMCQKMLKCRNNLDNYCLSGRTSTQPCLEECLGGCETHPSNCTACKHAMNDRKCVSQCPPPLIVSREESRTIANPEFKYNFHDICVKNCPAPFLKSDSYCVIECDLNSQIPVNGTCKECPKSGCPEHCTEETIFHNKTINILQLSSLRKFKSCVYYTGGLYLSKESFQKSSLFPDPIEDVNQLYNLFNLKSIVGYIYFDLRGAPDNLRNLTFLENLESVVLEVKSQSPGAVITIMNGENIESFGFKSLTNIGGYVYLKNMPKLCYISALTKMLPVRMVDVQEEELCVKRGHVCHSECLPELGCWGAEANMCAHCCGLKAGEYCVSRCTDHPGFYEVPTPFNHTLLGKTTDNDPICRTLPLTKSQMAEMDEQAIISSVIPAKTCAICHPECAQTCYGSKANQCVGECKHYQHGDTCVPECPRDTYIDPQTHYCLPCNESCSHILTAGQNHLCSGPGNFLGLGGCETCWTVMQDQTTDKYQCLPDDCPPKHFTESYQTQDFMNKEKIIVSSHNYVRKGELGGMIRVCKPCHPFCDLCTANGTHASICHSCNHWWFKSECVEVCPPAETYSPLASDEESDSEQVSENTLITFSNDTQFSSNQLKEFTFLSNASTTTNVSISGNKQEYKTSSLTAPVFLVKLKRLQRRCLLCHEQCIQGCSGPGPEDCVKCRNYQIILDEDTNKFVCNSSCPEERNHILHGMCLSSEQHARLSGQTARELRNRILISVAISVFVIIALVTIVLVVCLKRKAEAEKIREQLRSAYTNLLEPDMKTQSVSREPNMGRLEMINQDDLTCDFNSAPLGTGSFGAVFKGVWKVPKHALLRYNWHRGAQLDVAIKVILNDSPECSRTVNPPSPFKAGDSSCSTDEAKRASVRANIEELLQEAKVMASVMHRHCLPLIGICLSSERHCLVSIFVELGSLDRYVKQYADELNSLTLLSWAEQIADGMSYLEMRGIIHRDLAARNVLVQTREHVQITDFGLAKMLERRDEDSVIVKAGRVPIRWLAIETLQYGIYSHKTDVWSYGITLWEVFTFGKRPYEDVDTVDIKDHVIKGGRLTQPDICTLDVYMVLVKCWMEDYESRPTFIELMRTFNTFCKTPGRYLYIEGDQYALNYFPNTNSGSGNFSGESHELQPMLLMRGVPDGGATPHRNNSLHHHHTILTEPSMTRPISSGKLQRALSDQPSERPDPFCGGQTNEPTETQLLLPIRSNNGNLGNHSTWQTRQRGVGAGSSSNTCDAHFSGLSRIWKRTNIHEMDNSDNTTKQPKAPLASREDSWLNGVSKQSDHPESNGSAALSDVSTAKISDWSGVLPSYKQLRNQFNIGSKTLTEGNNKFSPSTIDSPSNSLRKSNDVDYLIAPPPPTPPQPPLPRLLQDDYLQPKTKSPLNISNLHGGVLTKPMNYTELGPPMYFNTIATKGLCYEMNCTFI
ncbi:Epidermal growth factor receptor isoform 5 [Schistosoma japonicum]|uniref:receptor protein-tyrosine kinase n=1 Tax=Schistosoma japonicum TaxID=6182 RepID=A0A4Z2DN41_SCHJA|nr:Epidermal growth factor receptor isoform 5 [Schistosoma japonicum]